MGDILDPPPCKGEGILAPPRFTVCRATLKSAPGAIPPEAGEASTNASSKSTEKTIKGSQAELARHLSILWLTPQMEHLFHEGASSGRKFLDRLVYGFDPEHASRINEYEFAMRERNKLLALDRPDTALAGRAGADHGRNRRGHRPSAAAHRRAHQPRHRRLAAFFPQGAYRNSWFYGR